MHIDRVGKTTAVQDPNTHHGTPQAQVTAKAKNAAPTEPCVSLNPTPRYVADPTWDVDINHVSRIQSQVENGTLQLNADDIAAALMNEIIQYS